MELLQEVCCLNDEFKIVILFESNTRSINALGDRRVGEDEKTMCACKDFQKLRATETKKSRGE